MCACAGLETHNRRKGVIFNLNVITAAGGVAINRVFEGEPDHLIPSVSKELLENNMFTMAGRMIGHSFLHNGPSFPGLSQAIIHVLFGGSLDTAPVTIRDCPDLDVREIVEKVSMKNNPSLHLFVCNIRL